MITRKEREKNKYVFTPKLLDKHPEKVAKSLKFEGTADSNSI